MAICDVSLTINQALFAPLKGQAARSSLYRECPVLSDEAWLELGITRALHDLRSGRGFLQQMSGLMNCPKLSHFFETLKSERRLGLCQEVASAVAQRLQGDPFSQIEALKEFELYAADGHWHAAAAHDPKVDERSWAVGQFYALNLRTQALHHLSEAKGKKEHDMSVLKRLDASALRLGAPKGKKVLYVYDRAGINFERWWRWKQSSGLYFLSRTKENMKLVVIALHSFEQTDPLNQGVQSDELVATSQHVYMRRIRYVDPVTGLLYEFITSECTLPPGLLAYLYLRRWDIEKVFDVLKNKLGETKAWASSLNAKAMQAQFLCLAHNLLILFERLLLDSHNVRNRAEEKRRAKRLAAQALLARSRDTQPYPLILALQRLTQTSLKLIRWLRAFFFSELPLVLYLPPLVLSYDIL